MMNILSSNRKQEHPPTSISNIRNVGIIIIIVIIIITMIIIIVMMRMIAKHHQNSQQNYLLEISTF